ncbi:MAG TPA: ABC transporter permease, partial [Planctomycetaceae bacterium]|nr:ABC transporter permease [Planctomycetaceae bacterium]
ATPKGFLSLHAAQKLWESRYGFLTSMRFAPPGEVSLSDFTDSLRSTIPASIEPREAGLAVLPVKFQGLQAAQGTTDFSGLFIGFSFFLILSAMILIGLLFRLGIERRVSSIGLLHAVGLHEKQVRRLMGSEALIVVLVGSLLGAVASVEYARLMIYGLTTWWVGAIGTSELELFVSPVSLVTGCLIAVFVAAVAVWWSLRRLKGHSVRALLTGNFEDDSRVSDSSGRPKKIAIVSVVIGGVLLALVGAGLIPDSEAFAGLSWKVVMFFVVGMLCLTAFLNGISVWIARDRLSAVQGHGFAALGHLAVRNAARNRSRSVFTVGLISSATFVIVAVAAGHRNPAVETPDFSSGNGGFRLIAESSQPILFDLNSEEGRRKLQLDQATDAEASALWKKTEIVSFRHKPGDDASCLNLYQTKLPTILGATERMIERGGFKFVGTSSNNPWAGLNEQLPDQDGLPVYPVFGDMNTLQYSLHKGVGDRIPVPNEETPEAWLEIAGMYDGSIFQGVLVASEENFFRMFPEQQGFSWFLIGSNEPRQAGLSRADADKLSGMLETGLDAYGFDVDRVADRLDAFLQVQNTYLTTFQTLGGLGLLLGTIGLGTVMLRNVVERRSELSLLRAVGFRNRSVGSLVVWENLFLLCWGLVSGTVSALLAMTPHLVSTGADVPWRSGLLLLAGVFATGMLSVVFAVRQAVHTPVLSTLRGE